MARSHEESSDPNPASAIRAAFDVLVFAPLGLGAKIVEDGPEVVAQIRQELNNARFIGRMAVSRGTAELRDRIEAASSVADEDRSDAARSMTFGDETTAGAVTVVREAVDAPGPDVDDLALPDYDHLPAIDIVAKLATMTPAQREVVGEYETAHRQRRTVLGKLAQLAEDPRRDRP